MIENDREKFVRLTNKRVNKTIKILELIGNLSNKSNYSYNEKDISKIFYALEKELENCKSIFLNNLKNNKNFNIENKEST